MANDPIHQFQIQPIVPIHVGNLDLSFTNSALFMTVVVGLSASFLLWATRFGRVIPGRAQSIAEMSYEFVASTLRENAGTEGMKFFPLVFTLFMFILMANLIGLFPYFFTVTAHIIITAMLAMTVMAVVVGYGFAKNGLGFLKLFVPHGVPGFLLPLVVFIEVLSFLSRPLSLSIRLFANMLAGHITLKVFAGFVVALGSLTGGLAVVGIVGAALPLAMAVALTALEFLVAFLQAYVFTILTCLYLNDAIHPGH
ncbi:MAG: F0F1 ATP synthase subunit A [Bauldia sp.]